MEEKIFLTIFTILAILLLGLAFYISPIIGVVTIPFVLPLFIVYAGAWL